MDEHLIHNEYLDFLKLVEKGKNGEAVFIKNSLDKVNSIFNLMQSRFTLLGSSSGAGKSSFIDDVYILKPWSDHVKKDSSIHWEVLYYSMERKKLFKHSRWASWMLYRDKKWLLSSDSLCGWDPRGPISEETYKVFRSYDNEMSDLLDSVHIYDGRISGKLIRKQIKEKALELGDFFLADSVGVTLNGGTHYIATFSKDKTRMTRNGPQEFVEITHKGEKFSLTKNTHKYIYHNPNTYLFIVLDGVGIVDATDFDGNVKKAVDDITNALADSRDVYGFSPVMVSQFNRSLAEIQRLKLHGANLAPQESDFKDSGNTFQAADLVLALFDSYKFKAYDANGFFGGYDILKGMISPQGHNRFRSLHVLKNSFGIDVGTFGLKYMGEVGHFSTLPPSYDPSMANIYADILMGR